MLAYGLEEPDHLLDRSTATDSDSSEQLQGDLSVSLRPAELAMGKLSRVAPIASRSVLPGHS